MSVKEPSGTSVNEEKPDKSAPATQKQGYELQQTTLDKFVAMNNYREYVRSEVLETLLDDHHDVLGKTLIDLPSTPQFSAEIIIVNRLL